MLQQVLHKLLLQRDPLAFLEHLHPLQVAAVGLERIIDPLVLVLPGFGFGFLRQAAGQLMQGLVVQPHHQGSHGHAHHQESQQEQGGLPPDPVAFSGDGGQGHQGD